MSDLDKAYLNAKSHETGFIRDNLEKVYRLTDVLEFVFTDRFLSERLILKGGTAINLTVFVLPRLSVDIDLDYGMNESRSAMLSDRKQISDALLRYMIASGYSPDPRREKDAHALASQAFSYVNSAGNRDNIKIEINYSMRCHVLPVRRCTVNTYDTAVPITSLATEELFGSKIKALLERSAPRDLFDIDNMVNRRSLKTMTKNCSERSSCSIKPSVALEWLLMR